MSFQRGIFQVYEHSLTIWNKCVKLFLAMIQQSSPPTIFVTFTSVESKWTPLIQIIVELES
jgi:hypothetical protein